MTISNSLSVVEFPGLSHHAFQHPFDSQATRALEKVPGLPRVLKFVSEKGLEKVLHQENLSSRLRVNARQYPSIHKEYVRLAQVLDVRKLPSLYIETTPQINAFASGIENYSIVLCSGLIDLMSKEELSVVLAHELGHVKCQHQLYKTTAYAITTFGDAIISQASGTPIAIALNAGRIGVEFAILDWARKAELSCDRAALLATRDVDVVAMTLAKLGGFASGYDGELNLDEVEVQAQDYSDLGADSFFMKLVKLKAMLQTSHPYPVLRVKEIRQWVASKEYKAILDGNYTRLNAQTEIGWSSVVVNTLRGRKCPNTKCGYPCDENFVFCPNCQTNVRSGLLVCGRCLVPVEPNWIACMECGNVLVPPDTQLDGEIETVMISRPDRDMLTK
jgi:Zn-dependent protease with chaperone function